MDEMDYGDEELKDNVNDDMGGGMDEDPYLNDEQTY